MKITDITINHMTEPLGFEYKNLHIGFKVEAEQFETVEKQVEVKTGDSLVYTSDFTAFNNNHFELDLDLEPRTRYDVIVSLKTTDGKTVSATSFFETGKMAEPFEAKWIANKDKDIQNTLFRKVISVAKPVAKARLYMTALGVYETFIDGQKVGNEFLAPGQTAYDQWVQLQTYDVTDSLTHGEHELLISTADGWFKGAYGFIEGMDCIYGDHHRALAEYHIEYKDGSSEVISTDPSWETTAGRVTKSAIYYGEDRDDTKEISGWEPVVLVEGDYDVLTDRLSLPLVVKETLDVAEILNTPAGETVLDFGQNHAGLFRFYNRLPKGTKVFLQVGEILQEDNFYKGNLRSARAAFEYISDGVEKWVQPAFTYYGFRYMKIEGFDAINPEDFKADVIYSDMVSTGHITTNNAKVNRLFENVIWGQKGNFFDVPTDCPQRDERLGWSGDANVFSNTALLNMDVYAFYRKYLKDLAIEQDLNDGRSPMYAPSFGNPDGGGAIWGDATTVVPWNTYKATGDASILTEHYDYMKAWVDWIGRQTKTKNLWTGGFQFGDWLALDGENPAMPTGKTDEDFIASIYYHYSAHIVAETAKLMGNDADAAHYADLSDAILEAIRNEYISANGRLTIDTQTAYALTLQFDLVPEELRERVTNDLVARLHKDDDHLKTGFVGTPFINQMLSKFGQHKLATKIFLLEDLPSWLYAVNMGATTIWERWNSVEPDGSMNPEGMNSLNHYSIGAIMEWAYKYVVGIRNPQNGYQEFDIAPEFDYRLDNISGEFDSPYGLISVAYQIESDENHTVKMAITVPFGSTAHVTLPRSENVTVLVNGKTYQDGQFDLTAGHYDISYVPSQNYIEHYSAETTAAEIMADDYLIEQIDAIDPVLDFFRKDPDAVQGGLGKMSLTKLNALLPFITISEEHLKEITKVLEATPILAQRQS
ncbi:alpha-L-rhamnosidase [Streptococcus moroccensis]|uniref:alpha-L-rhamnosidase n=1 Tax=Streptococcus moroccensis TaxID=1451356 RepID=A0ABT9YU25_9STRE|nr:alpha-L-rhamnosidase [Streptococcus moroccensis]MDQ0223219.1 alpha-L-rhamnosidase [Streptococcus moroccensis]